jgi:hypothetical protein
MIISKYAVRNLTENDIEQASDIFISPKKVMRTSLIRNKDEILTDFKYPGTTYVGAFADNELVAYMKYTIWKLVPVYHVGNLNVKSGILNRYDFSSESNPLLPVMNYILTAAEELGLYTWYYNRSLSPAYHKLQYTGKDMLMNCKMGYDSEKNSYRYDRFIVDVIKAGNRSNSDAFFNMAGKKIFDTDYMVVNCCLKPEYRNLPDYFNLEVIKECI